MSLTSKQRLPYSVNIQKLKILLKEDKITMKVQAYNYKFSSKDNLNIKLEVILHFGLAMTHLSLMK